MSGAHPKLVAETEFKIEKGVVVPPPSGGFPTKYPFAQMEVGDSVFFPGASTNGTSSGAVQSARNYARRHEVTFKARTVDGGVRIWRIA